MPLPRCPYCRETFERSHYHPDQAVCSARDCQRLRRAAYHRAKVHNDPSYRAQCRDSQKQWREQHPDAEYQLLLPFDPFEQSAVGIAPFNPNVVKLDLTLLCVSCASGNPQP